MGNCGTKPKTSDGDDAPPPPIEPQPAAGAAAEGERKDEEVAAPEPEGTSQAVVAPQSEVRKNDLNSRTALSITQTMALFAIPIEIQYVGLLLYDMANFRESHEATTTTVEEKEHDEAEPKEKEEEVAKEDADHGKETETPTSEEAAELPASTPASVA
ncbi:unnamed protein product [Miscanthus lutarioriparius]|uniref:Uncharacterized protein n=1 Tax=Miscanthus lutarioriparius TaxID=422564 RepID=A0A811RPZ9_9POAL|nr:unnamed protein product [Miscanthus lutarioriparius]